MMRLTNIALSALCVVGLSACTGASQESAEATNDIQKPAKTIKPYATVKPGASITLNSVLPKSMTSGAFQPVQLSFSEAYSDGTMSVRIEPSSGLRLFGGSSAKTFEMSTSGTHVWDLDVKADTDGVYFLNVFAEAQGRPRSFSVRLDIGQVTQKMLNDSMPAEGELVDGGKIRVMDATETIE